MHLQPRRPPGRVDRKAAGYASEIARLRDDGYTYEAIREAFADIGIALSTSALRREMRRLRSHLAIPAPPARPTLSPASPSPFPVVQPLAGAADPGGLSSRDFADAFFNANPSNALRNSKGTS